MNKGKKIGFFSGGNDVEFNGKLVNGMQEACLEEGIELLGFTSLMKSLPDYVEDVVPVNIVNGENQIYELADYNELDGIIILAHEFIDSGIMDSIVKRAKAAGKPVVIVDGEAEDCYSVLFSDESSMEEMVRHIVEFHGIRKVNFISGFKGNRQSEERLNAYKKVLTENNIPVEEERIGYSFFGAKTKEVMIDFINSELDFPEAIICANDITAMEVIGFMSDIGKSAPNDVIVTGFDGIMQGQTYCPALTSVRRAVYESGAEAVHLLSKIWEGKEVPRVTRCEAILIKNQSCGCRKTSRMDVSDYYRNQDSMVNSYKCFNADFINLTNEMSMAQSIEEILQTTYKN